MKRTNRRKGSARARAAGLAVLLGGLLLCAALPPVSPAAPAAAETPTFRAPGDEAPDRFGFIWVRGNVSAVDWSARKSVDANFTVKHNDGRLFRELRTEDIEAKLDGKPLTLDPGSLDKRGQSAPTKTLFMIDCSRSMVDAYAGGGVDKLLAAKESLSHFVGQLRVNDKAAVYTFATGQHENEPLTNDREKLRASISAIGVCYDGEFTNLYDSIEYVLRGAERNSVIVLLSDGMEDNSDARKAQSDDILTGWDQGYLRNYKVGREKALIARARDAGVRIFPIALGRPLDEYGRRLRLGSRESLKYVDLESLENISKDSNGGFSTPIDILNLSDDPALRQKYLTERLKDVLVEIKKSSSFAYSLPVKLSDLREGEGELQLNVTIPQGDQNVVRSLVWTYTWDKVSAPGFTPGRVIESFINPRPTVSLGGLMQIYLLLLSPLALLGLLPSFFKRARAVWEKHRIRRAVKVVGRDSPLIGGLCPNEQGPGAGRQLFREKDVVLVCPECKTPHHLHCWEYNRHECMSPACEYACVVPAEVMEKHKKVPAGQKQQTLA